MGAGEIVGDGFSVAWRVLDAQYWGVPQRRKRIYLVADFAGERAGKILFERESLRGHPATSGAPGQGTAANAARRAGGSRGVRCLNPWDCQSKRIYQPDGVYPTLPAMDCGGANNQEVLYALDSMSSNSMKSSNPHSGFHEETVAKTLQAGGVDPTCNQGGNVIVEPVYALQGNGIDRAETAGCNGKGFREDVCYTLNTIDRPAICFKAGQGAKARSIGASQKVTPTLGSEAGGNSVPSVCYPQVARTLTAEADASPCIDRGQNFVCVQNTGHGWWNQGDIAETIRTPAGGDSTKANLVVECYAPVGNHCGAYEDSSVSATMQTKYHYGSGGDAAVVVYSSSSHGTLTEGVGTVGTWTRAIHEMVAVYDTTQITSPVNHSNPKPGDPCHPLAAQQHPPLAVYDARDNGDGNGDGSVVPTLTGDHENRVTDYTAVCVGNGQLHNISMTEQMNTLDCMHDQQAVLTDGKPPRRYIIRRLTPLECCRLQGFPDGWGVPYHRDKLSDEELAFWQGVRDTCTGIAGKPAKKYSAESLTKWYNGLHTDSAEYKMWGNGIALPCAQYVMGGIAEELREAAQCTKA